MTISKETHGRLLDGLLVAIASSIVFRIPCTALLIAFALCGLLGLRRMESIRPNLKWVALIALPLLLHAVFLWNDQSLAQGWKSLEKYLSLAVLPVLVIGYRKMLDRKLIEQGYVIVFALLLVSMLVRYIIVFPEQFNKYLGGKHMWEMGYSFATSFKSHAPALNMHIAFAAIVAFDLILGALQHSGRSWPRIMGNLLVFSILAFFLLYVNTRLALVNTFLGMAVIVAGRLRGRKFDTKIVWTAVCAMALLVATVAFFVYKDPYMVKKYTKDSFAHLDKVGHIDEIDNARAVAFNSLVTRLSTWKSAAELGSQKPLIGFGGADGKQALFDYYKSTEQYFLYNNQMPVHNQFLDFFVKFGICGVAALLVYLMLPLWLGRRSNDALALAFFLLFFISNLTDDFMVRFDGIVFSGLWISLFAAWYLRDQPKTQPI